MTIQAFETLTDYEIRLSFRGHVYAVEGVGEVLEFEFLGELVTTCLEQVWDPA